jgi:hypothetical protein
MAALTNSDRCFQHSEEHGEARAEARKRGGRAATLYAVVQDVELENAADVRQLIRLAMSKVLNRQLDPPEGNCIATLCNVALKCLEVEALEKQDAPETERPLRGVSNEQLLALFPPKTAAGGA